MPRGQQRCKYEIFERAKRPDVDRTNVYTCSCKLCDAARVLHRTDSLQPTPRDQQYEIRVRFAALAFRGKFPDLISRDPEVMGGAPCISGTRMTVWTVYYRWEREREAFMRDYPYLTLRHITAALNYARAHPEETVSGQAKVIEEGLG